ncbi:phospholipase A2 inhibitor and Ly6/PLAUR domain-containing protein-like isoform X2 [Xiphophorus hellerii]|uniref:phospholipase A2 inhibitor and Ly6/PLAUR domain-containing protein-like isoform X2 n=1 Tax=Xiphophorus hellerii TaxID=8084 RepID=UPI0013B35BB3|nr:phospholipase A2 inhibitor and Ly6/PLAUR domain-containing protein-like isoform X2 [Xiphophorus hellerii]
MFLFTLVLVVLFLPEADNLKCKCEPGRYGTCAQETTECSSQNYSCLVATEVTLVGGAKSEHNSKGCIMSELCLNYSVNIGAHRIVQNSKCCSEDLCNAQINYTKPDSTINGKKCYSCDEENCMKTINCAGDENYCIKVTGHKQGVSFMTKGCGSQSACSDNFSSMLNQLTLRLTGFFTRAKISCCQGNYCNSASSTSPTLLLLLVPLLFSNFFS